MSSPAPNEQSAQQSEVVAPAAPTPEPPGGSSGDSTPTQQPSDKNSVAAHTITVQRVPHCVWALARENAKQSCLPFRFYLIRLFAASAPMQPATAPVTPRAPDNQPTHTISVPRVPYQVWAHVRHNAMLSQRTFSHYLIEVLEQSSPLPITVETGQPA